MFDSYYSTRCADLLREKITGLQISRKRKKTKTCAAGRPPNAKITSGAVFNSAASVNFCNFASKSP